MNARSGRIAGILLAGVLLTPGLAHASLWDLIWKMSGPQMSSAVLHHCEWAFGDKDSAATKAAKIRNEPFTQETRYECRVYDYRYLGYVKKRLERPMWFSLDNGLYFSTGKDPHGGEDPDYHRGDVWMATVEPIFEAKSGSWKGGNILLNHGIGVTYDLLFGDDFPTFDKFGLKLKPVTVTLMRHWNGTLTVRWLAHGTTPDEFGKQQPRLNDIDRKSEFVYGFSLGYVFN